jgi:hypothetical protein
VLRDEDDTPSVVRYMLENPVRAGLVENALDYPWIGSSRFTITALMESVCEGRPSWKRGRRAV